MHDPHAHTHAPPEEHDHPTARTYIWIAVVLTILTALEVLIYYVPALAGVLVLLVIVLGLAKFVLVVGYYMHLKFDAKILTWLFVFGLLLAVAMLTGLWALFNGWGG